MFTPSGLIVSRMRAARRRAATRLAFRSSSLYFEQVLRVCARDHERVTARGGIDVHERNGRVVGVDNLGRPFAGGDGAEDAVSEFDTAG